jgi:peptide/nickel transport system permease protein
MCLPHPFREFRNGLQEMMNYALRRAGSSLFALFLATILVFAGVRALPGDPAVAMSGETSADPELLEAIRARYGLDQPVPVQYFRWLLLALQGDLGQSIRTGLPVTDMIMHRLPITLELAFLSILLAAAIGIPAGVLAAVRRGRLADYLGNGFALFGLSIPNFWLGILLILFFSVNLGILPASGFVPIAEDPVENLRRMLMPAVVLGTSVAAVIMRQMRSSMLQSLGADYVRTARAKGLSERKVIGVHALRNSLTTVLTVIGLQLGALLSGAVITEQIFLIPGFGKLIIDAVFTRDYPVVQGVVVVAVTGYILVNLRVDLLYSGLNPKVRATAGAK